MHSNHGKKQGTKAEFCEHGISLSFVHTEKKFSPILQWPQNSLQNYFVLDNRISVQWVYHPFSLKLYPLTKFGENIGGNLGLNYQAKFRYA